MTRQQLFDFVKEEFAVEADFPFENDFETAIFRHKDNKKWFGILMKVSKNKFDINYAGEVETLNVKVEPNFRHSVLQRKGVKPAYHMNKTHWVSILIELADDEDIKFLLASSYDLTKNKKLHNR